MKAVEALFSPTGGTCRAAEAVSAAWPVEKIRMDLMSRTAEPSGVEFDVGDLCLAAVPSFGGRVPEIAARRLAEMKGNGARAVAMAVYGNRAYDDTLLELKDLLEGAGFVCAAAVAAVAQHSIMPQFAAGRPDERDRAELTDFGRRIWDSLKGEKARDLVLPGNRPYRTYGGLPLKPRAGKACTRCGLCAERCPVGAIPPDDPVRTDGDACITCMRCAAACPVRARALSAPMVWAAARKMKKSCEGRKENQLFLPEG